MTADRLAQALRDIDTVLRVEGMDLELGSRRLLKEVQGAIREASESIASQSPAEGDEPLFLLHCGQIDSSGEQDDWDVEPDSGKRVEEFCLLHPGEKIKLYPHVQPKRTVAVPLDLIRRAQQAINWHLEPGSPEEYNATMLELSAIGWPGSVPSAPSPAPAPVALSPTASLKWDHDGQGGYYVEMRVNSLRSEDHAHAAMAYMERLFCGGEINVN